MRHLRFVFLLILILAVIFVGVAAYLIYFALPPAYGQEGGGEAVPVEVEFEVYSGESTAAIASRLANQGLIRGFLFIPAEWIFRGWASLNGLDQRLEAGRYTLRTDMTMDQILQALTHAPAVPQITFTIREGLRLEEVAEELERQGVVPVAEFMAALEQPYDYDFLKDRPEGASLEGYLFPDTYTIPRAFTATQVVDFLLKNFDQKFTPAMREAAKNRGMSIYEVVTLASIVEREAVLDDERPMIASVYLNRLEIGMALEADPTVQYAVGYNERQGKWWPVLYFDELGVERLADVDSPYNTYRYPGLPVGPICSSRQTSLRAIVEPAETDYYYFVSKGDKGDRPGEHAFARTLEEHNANVARYQQ